MVIMQLCNTKTDMDGTPIQVLGIVSGKPSTLLRCKYNGLDYEIDAEYLKLLAIPTNRKSMDDIVSWDEMKSLFIPKR